MESSAESPAGEQLMRIETLQMEASAVGVGDRSFDPSTGAFESSISGPKYDFAGIEITGLSGGTTIGR